MDPGYQSQPEPRRVACGMELASFGLPDVPSGPCKVGFLCGYRSGPFARATSDNVLLLTFQASSEAT